MTYSCRYAYFFPSTGKFLSKTDFCKLLREIDPHKTVGALEEDWLVEEKRQEREEKRQEREAEEKRQEREEKRKEREAEEKRQEREAEEKRQEREAEEKRQEREEKRQEREAEEKREKSIVEVMKNSLISEEQKAQALLALHSPGTLHCGLCPCPLAITKTYFD